MFTPEEIERFKNDRDFFFRYRSTLENEMNVSIPLIASTVEKEFTERLSELLTVNALVYPERE